MSCPHCGYEADPEEAECPLCGTTLEGTRGGGAPGPDAADSGARRGRRAGAARTGGAGSAAAGLTPWEESGGIGALARTWWESLSEPSRFFSRVDWDGGLESPLLYYLLFVVVGSGLQSLWTALLMPVVASALGVENLLPVPGGTMLLSQFFLSPFKALFSLAVFAGAAHLALTMLADRPRRLRATARVFCYSAGPQLLMVVPFLGGLAAVVWSAVLAVVGLRAAHRSTTGRVVGALVLTVFAYVGFSTVWGLVVQGAFGGSLPLTPAG